MSLRRSFWVPPVNAENDHRSRHCFNQETDVMEMFKKCDPSVFSKNNSLYVPVDVTIPGKMRWIFCSSSTATSWNLY